MKDEESEGRMHCTIARPTCIIACICVLRNVQVVMF